MTHPRQALSAYLDRELREDERRAVETHLAGCAACAREMEELAAVDTLAREAAAPEAPAGYFDALPSRVRARIRAPRRRLSPLWLVPLAAGLMVAVLAPPVLRDNAARDTAAKRDAPARAPAVDSPVAQAPAPAAEQVPPATQEAEEVAPRMRAAPPATREQKREAAATLAKEGAPAASTVEAREEARPRADARQAPFAPPPPAAERDLDHQGAAEAGGAAGAAPSKDAMADAAYAGAEPKAAAPAQNRVGAVGGRLSSTAEAGAAAKAKKAVADDAFLEVARIPLDTTASARRAREEWRRYVAAHPANDEARVRLVEAAVAAYRASGAAADRAVAEREADLYLSRGDSPGADRVRAARRELEAPR